MRAAATKPPLSAWAVASLALMLLYMLSVPPVVCLTMRKGGYTTRWLATYAGPYFAVVDSKPLAKPFEHYFDWCWHCVNR